MITWFSTLERPIESHATKPKTLPGKLLSVDRTKEEE